MNHDHKVQYLFKIIVQIIATLTYHKYLHVLHVYELVRDLNLSLAKEEEEEEEVLHVYELVRDLNLSLVEEEEEEIRSP